MSIFVNYDGIKGESSDIGHRGWMDVESISWQVGRKITSNTSTKGDRESSNAEITDLLLVRNLDSATPKIFSQP